MKLFYCPYCQDVVTLQIDSLCYCNCSRSWGSYTDILEVTIGGAAIPLGIDWKSLAVALRRHELGVEGSISFDAFVIPENCPTVKREE